MAKTRKKGSTSRPKGSEWTMLEMGLVVLVVALAITATYAFMTNDEIVEVGTIETYAGKTDLRAGDAANSTYSFVRHLKEDYQVHIRYDVPYEGMVIQPIVHFKVWNETTGKTLIKETIVATYDKNIRLDAEDAGTYEFVWWVDGPSGASRVEYDVLIQPTEKLFEKRT
jgi:hypothetical protein